jgi:hypothetical protein
MVKPYGHVDRIHGVNREFVSAGLDIKAHAVEHRLEVQALLAPQRPAKHPLPIPELLLDQIPKR